MSLSSLYHAVRSRHWDQQTTLQANQEKLGERLLDVFLRTWDLGFTGFGGPPAHLKIIHQRFVEGMGLRGGKKTPWIDENKLCVWSLCVRELY